MIGAAVAAPIAELTRNAVDIEGQTVYDDLQLHAVYADQLGKTITLADVFGIADRLTTGDRLT